MATYVNDLRLKEIATGDESGTWGTSTNTNLELIAEAFSYGTEAITTNADTHTTTIADGATDPGRALYLKYTGTLDSACTITIGPNTVSKVWIVENGTSGSQDIILSQGSGANITIPAGDTKVVYSDGAGSGAAFVDAFASLNVGALTATTVNNIASKAFGTSSIMIGDTTTGTISAADYNTGVGVNVFEDLTSGDNNSAFGFNALTNITTGGNNTAIGRTTLVSTTTQSDNTAVGYAALNVNAAANNTAVGSSALAANTSGTRNTAVGYAALDAVTTTNDHTAVGYNALTACTSGDANTAVGTSCADAVTSGANNTAMGNLALSAATTTDENTAIGSGAMRYSTGAANTAIGKSALGASSNSGNNNTIVGAGAGISLTSASNNTCIGKGAGNNQITGGQNVFVGENARGSAVDTNASIAIGYNVVGVGNFYVTLGSGAGSDRIYNQFDTNASWTRVSDLRYKEEIANNTDCGLSFINDLRPVTYKFKPKANIDNTLPDYDASKTSRNTEKKMYGLIAQEVKQAMDDNNITDFAGWDETAEGIQGISQEMFIHPLIKAVQELTALNDALEARIAALES